jgi:hypothetical protein
MAEAVVAVAGIILCWLIAVVTYEDNMSFTRYAIIALLSVMAAYFAVRFVHWAWVTPVPFVGTM